MIGFVDFIDQVEFVGEDNQIVFEAETDALVARFTTPPSNARKILINNFILSLKDAGVWAKLDALYVMAAADAQSAKLNWIADAFNLTEVSSPVFTQDRGFAGNGSSSYLNTGFNPTTAVTPKFTQNSGHLSIYDRSSRAGADTVAIGSRTATNHSSIIPRSATGNFIGRITSGTNALSVTNAESSGDFVANRSASNALQGYRNGAQITTSSAVSVTSPNASVALLARAVASSTPDAFSSDQLAIASIGASLSGAEVLAAYNAKVAFLEAIGAL